MIVCVCVCVLCIYVRVPVYGGQRTTLWSWFSPCSFNVGFKNHIQVSRLLPQTLLLSHLSGPKVSPSRPDPTAVYQDPTWDLLCHPSPVTVDRCICSILNTEQIKSQGRKLGLSTWEICSISLSLDGYGLQSTFFPLHPGVHSHFMGKGARNLIIRVTCLKMFNGVSMEVLLLQLLSLELSRPQAPIPSKYVKRFSLVFLTRVLYSFPKLCGNLIIPVSLLTPVFNEAST